MKTDIFREDFYNVSLLQVTCESQNKTVNFSAIIKKMCQLGKAAIETILIFFCFVLFLLSAPLSPPRLPSPGGMTPI